MQPKDKACLRTLAQRVAEIAARPQQAEKRQLWKDHNMLRPTRPVIFCDPEHGWGEIIPDASLQCEDARARRWEFLLRRELFWGEEMGDDRVIEPYFDVPFVSTNTGWGIKRKILGGGGGNAYSWEPMIEDYETDFPKLHFPKYTVDHAATRELRALAQEVFEPYLTVRTRQAWWWTLGLTATAIEFRGLEQFMFDMYDYPDEVHAMMRFLTDGTQQWLTELEAGGLLHANTDDSYVGSGGFGYTDELPRPSPGEPSKLFQMWGFAESQETVGVSPAMFKEFIYPYQHEILSRFGLNCYGCCEPVDTRWDAISQTPNLRRVSVSPWADIDRMAEYLQGNYVYSLKPNPSYLAVASPDFAEIERQLQSAMNRTKNCRLEIIMKDNHTIGGNPQNVIEWCKTAKRIAENIQ